MTDSNINSDQEPAPRRGKRFGWPMLLLVALAAFWAGGVVRNRLARSQDAFLVGMFPFFMQVNSPVTIDVEWNAIEKEVSGSEMFKLYSGPATYIIKNQSDRPIKIAFPPQNGLRFHLQGASGGMSPRNPDDLPQWARATFVLTLRPDEERRFEEKYSVTSQSISAERTYGPFAFDFAAPADADASDYVTGTVLCSMKMSLTK